MRQLILSPPFVMQPVKLATLCGPDQFHPRTRVYWRLELECGHVKEADYQKGTPARRRVHCYECGRKGD